MYRTRSHHLPTLRIACAVVPLALGGTVQAVPLTNGLGGPVGFGESIIGDIDDLEGEDDDDVAIDLTGVFGAAGLNVFGQSYTSLFLDTNGTISFGRYAYGDFDPYHDNDVDDDRSVPLGLLDHDDGPVIGVFNSDIDPAGTDEPLEPASPGGNSRGTNLVWYDLDDANSIFTATWDDVFPYSEGPAQNAFQLALLGRGNGDFDVEFRYESIEWGGDDDDGTTGFGPWIGLYDGKENASGVFSAPGAGIRTAAFALPSLPVRTYSFANGTPTDTTPSASVPLPNSASLLFSGLLFGAVPVWVRRRRRLAA